MLVTLYGMSCLTMVENLGCEIMKWPVKWEKRTSRSHPIKVDWFSYPAITGKIGITLCPGKRQPMSWSGGWNRDLETDIGAITKMGTNTVISLIDGNEMKDLNVSNLGEVVTKHEMDWIHLPLMDTTVPSDDFIRAFVEMVPFIAAGLESEDKIVIHCKGGLGRAATIASMILGLYGEAAKDSINKIRKRGVQVVLTLHKRDFFLKIAGLIRVGLYDTSLAGIIGE